MIFLLLALQEESVVTEARIRELAKSVPAIVEKETGVAFRKAPEVVIATADEVAAVLTEELVPQLRIQFPTLSDETLKRDAKSMARAYARLLLAKYGPKDHKIFLLADTFVDQAKRQPAINTEPFLRMMVIHEMVHASDQERFELFTNLGGLKSTGEIEIWNALAEGHAQFVTHRILKSEQNEKLFFDYEKIIGSDPEAETESERYFSSLMTHQFRWGYIEGKAFFDGLEKSGKKTFIEDVFRTPPASKAVILHPERYYDPKAAAQSRDLKPLWDELKKLYPEEWKPLVRDLDESQVRTGFGTFLDAKRVSECLKGFVGGQVLLFTSGDRMVYLGVYQMESAAAAGRLYDALSDLGRAKDKKLTSGSIRITKSEYAQLKTTKPGRHESAFKIVEAMGSEIEVRMVTAEYDAYVIEILYSNEPAKDADLVDRVERMCGFLEKK